VLFIDTSDQIRLQIRQRLR